jgi:penicillin-binding protein 1C
VERLRSLGIAVPGDGSDYGGAIVLGGLSITPWQLTEAYVALSRGGTHVPLAVVPAASIHTAPVMRASAALLTRDILEDASARREGFGDDLRALAPGEPFALKTGTSSGWRDAWTAVFDDRLTVLVWLGDPVGVPMRGVSGFQAAAPAAVRILAAARRRADADDVVRLATPNAPLVEVSVCAHSGLRAGPHCTHVLAERFVPGSVPAAVCDAHDASGHDVLAPRYASWVAHAHPSNVAVDTNAPAATGERLEIRSPSDGARLAVDRTRGDTVIPLRATLSDRGAVPAQWLVDGNPVSDGRWVARPGHHSIAARWNGLRSREVQVEVIAVGALRAAR